MLLTKRSCYLCAQGLDFKHGHPRVHCPHLAPYRSNYRLGISHCPHDERHLSPACPGPIEREIEHRAPLFAKTPVSGVLDHTDDFYCGTAKWDVKTETPPNWILLTEETARHAFVYHGLFLP